MADEVKDTAPEKPKSSSALKPILIVGIGCFVLLFIIGTALALAGGLLAKKTGISFFQSLIEKNTGVKTNLGEIEKGKLSFTDKQTGAKVDVGSDKLPDNFPKDFPLYPGAKVAGSLSGSEEGKQSGFWITLTTMDSTDQVSSWYKTNLKAKNWEIKSTLETGQNVTWSITKESWEGTVSVSGSKDEKQTTIALMLSQGQTPAATATPEESLDQGSL